IVLLAVLLLACGSEPAPRIARTVEPAPDSVAAPPDEPDQGREGDEPAPAPEVILALDTHVDTPQRMLDARDDIAERQPDGHLDLPRMREGGLGGAFFSIWVDPDDHPGERAWAR